MFRNASSIALRDAESRRLLSPVLPIAACLLLVACGGGGSGGGGTGGGGGPGYQDPPEPPPPTGTVPDPTLSSIQSNVFTPICTECHIGASAPEGLRLEDGLSYSMLVNMESSQVPSLMRVEPGNPDDSYIIHKLEGTNAVGVRMPEGGPYLSAEVIAAIRQWITDGAQDNKMSPSSKPRGELAMITMGWPVADSSLAEAPQRILLMADTELDTTLINANSVQLLKLDESGDLSGDLDTARTVSGVTFRVTSLAPTVIRLGLADDDTLQPGRYAVRVKGSGAWPLADRAGRLIDGDADGVEGGDFVARFDIKDTE